MSVCPALAGAPGVASALRAIDCRAGETTTHAFGRLFGAHGGLTPVLTAALTLYVAFFAITLLTGRSRINISSLTHRMLTLGLVLTFATSWTAYERVVWTLANGAPDQIATLLAGIHGSATFAFADRLDHVFAIIAGAASQMSSAAAPTTPGAPMAPTLVDGFSAALAMQVSALMLMLGTAGVLVTAKIALAALLAIGPLFVVLALFGGTRGLFEGWLKAVVLFAMVPLLAVLIGGGAVAALTPMAEHIALLGNQPEPRDVAMLFVGTCVYCALMLLVLRTAATIVAGWHPLGARERDEPDRAREPEHHSVTTIMAGAAGRGEAPAWTNDRARSIASTFPVGLEPATVAQLNIRKDHQVVALPPRDMAGDYTRPAIAGRRNLGIGSRFRAAPALLSKGHVS